jgi:branched-chain amino acid aminotransferase
MTPPLAEHILASITRRVVIEQCGAVQRECTLEDLAGADEAFLASTVREVQPVAAIDERSFGGVGPVTSRIVPEVAARIQSELDHS